jgi:hypothetical protein
MSDTYGASSTAAPLGGSLNDLVSTQKGGVQIISRLVRAVSNAMPPATASTSPVATGVNNLGTTGTTVVAKNALRHGILFSNPSTTVVVYIYPTAIATAPTLSAPGGALPIASGSTVPFPCAQFPNVNAGFSAFASAGTTSPLTIWEFF